MLDRTCSMSPTISSISCSLLSVSLHPEPFIGYPSGVLRVLVIFPISNLLHFGIDASTCSLINSFTREFLSGYGFACPFTLSLNLKLRPLRMQMECWRSHLSASFGGSADSFQLFGRSQCNARKQLVPGIKTFRGSANVGQRRVL